VVSWILTNHRGTENAEERKKEREGNRKRKRERLGFLGFEQGK
jgi:hypothetical protein